MKPGMKGQVTGGAIGLIIGGMVSYGLWGLSPPGGILILFGAAIGGLVGRNIELNQKN